MADGWHPGQLLFIGFDGVALPDDVAALVAAGRVGGAILFARNVESPDQVRRLVADLHAAAPDERPLTVAIDQEGGRVQRLRAPWTEWPPMRVLGERGRVADSRAVGVALGRELADLGIDLDFTPCVDVDTNPANPVIGDRSFAREPEDVARHAVALLQGLQSAGVAGCAKHFPGHGDTHLDSHVALPRVAHDLARLRAVELPPFRALAEAGVASMMTAHVIVSCLDPERPATLAPSVLELLRGEVGYDGLVFGDDFEMAAVADHAPPAEARPSRARRGLRRPARLQPLRRARRGAGCPRGPARPGPRGRRRPHGALQVTLVRRPPCPPRRPALRRPPGPRRTPRPARLTANE